MRDNLYGDVVRLRLPGTEVYLLHHPDHIAYVLRGAPHHFIKDALTRRLSRLLGHGLLTSEGERWRQQLRLAQPAFQPSHIRHYDTVMTTCTARLLQQWQDGQQRDMHHELSYCAYLLAQHPHAERALVAEWAQVLGGRTPTAAEVPQMRYTTWVVREALRLYPPAWSIGREAIHDCTIGGYHVPKGTQLYLNQWVVHRDPRWFDEPDVFKPQRWEHDLRKRLPHGAYFPFGDGPRVCIGNHFAMLETVLVLATIGQRCSMSLVSDRPLVVVPSVTLRPKHGVPMVVHRRIRQRGNGGREATGGARIVLGEQPRHADCRRRVQWLVST